MKLENCPSRRWGRAFDQVPCPCRRWGEAEKEKGPVDLFPAEPTDEALCAEETLDPGGKGLSCTKKPGPKTWFIVQEMGLEPLKGQRNPGKERVPARPDYTVIKGVIKYLRSVTRMSNYQKCI